MYFWYVCPFPHFICFLAAILCLFKHQLPPPLDFSCLLKTWDILVFNPVRLKLNLYAKLNPALLAQPRIKFSPLFALTKLKFFIISARSYSFVNSSLMQKYIHIEVQGPPWPRLLVGGPSGPLDFVLCALRVLRPCDPRNSDWIVRWPVDSVLACEWCFSRWIVC